jgi:ABC-type nickel/cobalt efflux system permease component RcnA
VRLTATLLLAAAVAAALCLWLAGGYHLLFWWAAQWQHDLQDALAGRIQEIRAGHAAAFWTLLGLCAAYGFLHAVGPGHGKLLVSGAAVGSRATGLRMSLIAIAGSLAQAAVAILLVYGALALLELTARNMVEAADRWITPVGNIAVALVGAVLLVRGLRGLRGLKPARAGRAEAHRPHDAHHCGHHHGPTATEVAAADSPAATMALIAAMAMRPCTGALFVLVLAWRMGLAGAGAAAVVAMGLGTAAFTVIVAALAVAGRDAAFLAAGGGHTARLLAPALQVAAGGLILGISGTLALSALPL